MTDEQLEMQDQLLNDATHAAADEFAACGIELTTDELYRINDLLTEILNGRIPVRRKDCYPET